MEMNSVENTVDALVDLSAFVALFDEAEALMLAGEPVEAIRRLALPLNELVDPVRDDPDVFPQLIRTARDHEVFKLLQQDPNTRRAFDKPRGYAGDAVMLDYVYTGVPPSETSAWARRFRCHDPFADGTERGSPQGLAAGLYRRCDRPQAGCAHPERGLGALPGAGGLTG
jgi:hypothetical protein